MDDPLSPITFSGTWVVVLPLILIVLAVTVFIVWAVVSIVKSLQNRTVKVTMVEQAEGNQLMDAVLDIGNRVAVLEQKVSALEDSGTKQHQES
ncbi:MAG: hypothetical protein FWF88_12170 [Peptococcaceae bacterium]|nr:hypothetical protein [Peptococcaceae bacterium]